MQTATCAKTQANLGLCAFAQKGRRQNFPNAPMETFHD